MRTAEDLLGLRQVLGGGPEADFDGQRRQVLLRAVVNVAFQPPPRLILDGDQPLPGRAQGHSWSSTRSHTTTCSAPVPAATVRAIRGSTSWLA